MKNKTCKLCNTTLSASLKIPAIWYTYPKEKGGVSLFQGGLLFQHKRNQSEQTNKLGSRHWMWTGNGPLTCPGLGPGACPAEPQCLGWPPCSCLSPRPRSSPCRSYALRGSEDCSVRTATPLDNCRPVHHAQPAGPTHRRVPWQPSPSNTLPGGGQRSNPESAILHGGRVGLYCDVAS